MDLRMFTQIARYPFAVTAVATLVGSRLLFGGSGRVKKFQSRVTAEVEELKEKVAAVGQGRADLHKKFAAELQESKVVVEAATKSLQKQTDGLTKEVRELAKDVAAKNTSLAAAVKETAAAQAEIKKLQAEIKKLEADLKACAASTKLAAAGAAVAPAPAPVAAAPAPAHPAAAEKK